MIDKGIEARVHVLQSWCRVPRVGSIIGGELRQFAVYGAEGHVGHLDECLMANGVSVPREWQGIIRAAARVVQSERISPGKGRSDPNVNPKWKRGAQAGDQETIFAGRAQI